MTVDLAAKFSAVVVREEGGEVHSQFDSLDKSSFEFVTEILENIVAHDPQYVIVEDVPYGISGQGQVKNILRLQGILIHALRDHLDKVLFVTPSTWQNTYRGVARGKPDERVEAARLHALRLGYTPPDLVQEYTDSIPEGKRVLKKHTNPLAKVMTDYIDAFLMSEWAIERNHDFNISGVQPVFI